jgi:hypothetical protein
MIAVLNLLHRIGEGSLLAPTPVFYANSVDGEFGA